LKLQRQVNAVIKYLDAQYADTMSEESKVIRQSKGDQHIHLCIYMIDPGSIMTEEERSALSSFPFKTRSQVTVSKPPDLVPDDSGDESDDDDEGPPRMSNAEIKVIRRLAERCNVLPVIARADSLTDEKLRDVKSAVRSGLAEAGIDFGVFGPSKKTGDIVPKSRHTKFAVSNANETDSGHGGDSVIEEEDSEEEEEAEERPTRPVIKLRPTRHGRNLSHSRSRRDLSQAAEDDRRPLSPDATDRESVANVRFSAHIIAKADLSNLLPFALIAPEANKHHLRHASSDSTFPPTVPSSPSQQPSEDGHAQSVDLVSRTPASVHNSRLPPFLNAPPADLKGVFVRKFRWGTVDVLDPNHCDFAALRTAVLSTHLKLLKIRTKEVLYEKYRTEKLVARRATSQISEEERQRLLEDLGL